MWKMSASTPAAVGNVSEVDQHRGHTLARKKERGIGAMAPVDMCLV